MQKPEAESIDSLSIQVPEEGKNWYVIYTRSRAEKKVHLELTQLGIESYVPLHKIVRQWKDRRKTVEEPIIRSYVFVRLNPIKRDHVFKSMHAIRYITFEGRPAIIPDRQIDALKKLVGAEVPLEATMTAFHPGEQVKVIFGPMIGIQGEFVSIGSEKRFLLRISNIGYSMVAQIPAAWVEKVEEGREK